MNDTTTNNNHNGAQGTNGRNYPGELNFYHANSKGSGSAVRFELKPARGRREGYFFMVLARQLTNTVRRPDGTRQMGTFDWNKRLNIKLNIADIGEMLLVLRKEQESVNGGRGLFHDTPDANTVINLRKGGEIPGYLLEASRKGKTGQSEPQRIRIVLTEAEALVLRLLFEQSLLLLVCGATVYEASRGTGEIDG